MRKTALRELEKLRSGLFVLLLYDLSSFIALMCHYPAAVMTGRTIELTEISRRPQYGANTLDLFLTTFAIFKSFQFDTTGKATLNPLITSFRKARLSTHIILSEPNA